MNDRRSHAVTVGAEPDGVAATVRYPGDDDPIVALLTEVIVAELLAAHWWLESLA
jgi:glucosamine--fructose-6-phosphate aminotransferase (isomerizing)